MSHELRSLERRHQLRREEWITKFVNAVVVEFRPGFDRMLAVAAARDDEWTRRRGENPREAAQEWVSRSQS